MAKKRLAFTLFVSALFPFTAIAEPILQTDFENVTNPLPISAKTANANATAQMAAVGTIDVAGGTSPSQAAQLVVKAPSVEREWSAEAVLGPAACHNKEADLNKITLSFMASVSTLQPVTVRIESLDDTGRVTGAGQTDVYPAAPDFYQRYAMELSSLKQNGPTAFDPKSPQIRLSFGLKSQPGLPPAKTYELRIDNVELTGPSFYVSPTGNDQADGKTEATAFATPQHALTVAGAGDVVLLKGGEYRATGSVIDFPRPGTPAGWITVKNAPGETPVLKTNGWHAVRIGLGSKESPSTAPGIAYIEVRGLTVIGSSTVDANGGPVSPFPESLGKAVAESNSNGVLIEGRQSKYPVHHIRIADCTITRWPGAGVAACYADWVSFENNTTNDNSWFTSYACSGISILCGSQFDGMTGNYRFLVSGNRSNGNRCYQKWTTSANGDAPKKLSDGNGIIIDTLIGTAANERAAAKGKVIPSFTGRTLVVNNISFNNGGSGIHLVSSPNVDLVNNTCYLNGQTPETKYSQMYGYRSPGSNFVNNILIAPAGQKYNLSSAYGEAGNTNCIWSHNLYFGSDIAPKPGSEGVMADPTFVEPSPNPSVANFTLRTGSPALAAGTREVRQVPIPLVDIDGHPRPLDVPPSIGASQP